MSINEPLNRSTGARRTLCRLGMYGLILGLSASFAISTRLEAQDVVSSQLRQGFGKNKVRYKNFDWYYIESEHLELYYEPEFEYLADRAVQILEEAYDHISDIMRHELSAKPPIFLRASLMGMLISTSPPSLHWSVFGVMGESSSGSGC